MVSVDGDRLSTEIGILAHISSDPYPAVTRVLFSEPDMAARAWFTERCEEAGLAVRADGIGNLVARWEGSDPHLPAVATGSHTDAIPLAGQFDGVIGVLGGLEAIRALKAAGHRPRRSIELVMFTAEEPTRFGIGCIGSRVMASSLTADQLTTIRDAQGMTLAEAASVAGYTGETKSAQLQDDHYAAFVELHIEQGPRLEASGRPIGLVTAIAAPSTLRVTFAGPGGHAGAVLMSERHDPMLAAAETLLAVDQASRGSGSPDTVGTCGFVQVSPGAVNSIPREVGLLIDVRDIDGERRDGVLAQIRSVAKEAGERHGVQFDDELLNADPPAQCDEEILAASSAACTALGLESERMISRAYHDSLFMARVCPTAMIFIPSRGGVSHRPDEYSSPEQIRQGVEVLAGTLLRLSGSA